MVGHSLWHNRWLQGIDISWTPDRATPEYHWLRAGVHRVEQIVDTTEQGGGWIPLMDIRAQQHQYA